MESNNGYKRPTKSPRSDGTRTNVVPIIVCCALVACIAVAVFMTLRGRPASEPLPVATPGTPGTPDIAATTDQPSAKTTSSNPELPFTISGVDGTAQVTEVGDAETAPLGNEWSFGGDYSAIGSIPVDTQTVFGSASATPEDISSYAAALITQAGTWTPLETPERPEGATFYEPQDGTANGAGIVWRASVSSNIPQAGTDNWQIRYWDKKSGQTRTLGAAQDINGTDSTPTAAGETIPTANGTSAFFASNTKDESGNWVTSVVSMPLDGSGVRIVGQGNYPTAIGSGVVYAADVVNSGDRAAPLYGTLKQSDGTSSGSDVFKVSSSGNNWGITGIWATWSKRIVCISSDNAANGSYLGIWDAEFGASQAWLHIPSPSASASANETWLVWGAGSQESNAQMYAFRFSDGKLLGLGAAPGYSRPSIAYDNDTVLIPVYNGPTSAVSFRVGTLD